MWTIILLISQIISCYSANGILTYEPVTTSMLRRQEDTNPNWQTILKSAMFRTLSKYTGFSPSLDVKMEADSLLWEKLDSAKYSRKILKPGEEGDRLKTGALIDLSRENGHLEFTQVDRSLYRSVPQDQRLLALWRIRMAEPNTFLIQVKIPEDPPTEFLYEYNRDGLREINAKNLENNRSKQNKNGTWKTGDRKVYSSSSEVFSTRIQPKSLGHNQLQRQQYDINRHKTQQQPYRYQKVAPRPYLYKPAAQYYTVVGYQTPPPAAPQYTGWNQENQYYPTTQTKTLAEFKQESDYNGFIPSLGPTGSPPLYEGRVNEPVTYKQPVSYFPPYIAAIQTTPKPYPITYFKPSTPFIQYSELDPFYSPNETYTTYNVQAPTGIPALGETIAQYPQFIYNTPATPSISVQVPPVEPGISLYDIAINTIRNVSESTEELSIENEPLPTTEKSLTIENIPQTETADEMEFVTEDPTTEALNPTTAGSSLSKTRVKNSLRNSQRTSNTGQDSYDYTPLYIQWGEKIKTDNKVKTTTEKSKVTEKTTTEHQVEVSTESEIVTKQVHNSTQKYEKKESSETSGTKPKYQKPSERLQDLQKRRQLLKLQIQSKQKLNENVHDQNKTSENLKASSNNDTSLGTDNGSNVTVNNVTLRTPEEVVRDLTTMGFQNSTNSEYSENLRNANAKNLAKENNNNRYTNNTQNNSKDSDSHHQSTDPVSVVVNRISQSISYKTSVGHTGNLKQLPDKT